MPRKKQEQVSEMDLKPGQKVMVWPKTPIDWMAKLGEVAEDHWRTLRVTIRMNEKLMAGKPARLDVAEAMLKARGLEDQIDVTPIDDPAARADAASEVEEESKCEFHRRPDKTGIWLPANNVKAMLKENWSALGLRLANRGSRGAMHEDVFVFGTDPKDPEWIYLGSEPDGEESGVIHAIGPAGPRTALKRNEYVEKRELAFLVVVAKLMEEKLPPADFARMLYHAQFHGLGANRSQGQGTFRIVAIEELVNVSMTDEQRAVAS